MALHMNAEALRAEGWKQVAKYECYEKGSSTLHIECYVKYGVFLVRDWTGRGKVWDAGFTDKNEANNYVKSLWSKREWHKKVA